VKYRAVVELDGTATGIEVPDDVVSKLDSGQRPRVVITIGPHSYRTTVAAMGGRYLVPLADEHREASGVRAGDYITVDIELDDEPRSERSR
jgi:hypothetical protein